MFDFFRKLIKALNSSEHTWQISLGAALGLIPGLTPVFSLHNLLFIFLAFLINVNLGVFIVSIGFFAGLAYLADPLMESLGYWLLTLPALEGMWTVFYNNPWLKLTGFNDSLVLGSLVSGLILAVPAYFFFEWVAKTYRGPVSRFTGKLPIVRSFLAFDETAAANAKKPGKVRWWGAGVFVALAAPIAVFALFFMDALVKNQLEKALSEPIGMQASIDRLETTLSPLSLTIEGIQIPDAKNPLNNAAQIDRVAFNLDMAHLFHKKVLIDEMRLEGIRLETRRQSPAQVLEKPRSAPQPETPAESKPEGGFASGLSAALPDPKTVAAQETAQSKERSAQIQKRLNEIKTHWDNQLKTRFGKNALADLEAEYKAIEAKAGKIKTEKELRAVLQEAKAFEQKLSQEQEAYQALSKAFKADQAEAQALIKELEGLPDANFQALKDKYSFDSEGAFNMAGTLLGDDAQKNLMVAREWYERLLPYLQTAQSFKASSAKEAPPPPRGEGRIVRFKEHHPRPEWHLKIAGFDLTTASGSRLAGLLSDASDNQNITGKPMIVSVQSVQGSGYGALNFEWISERRAAQEDRLKLVIDDLEKSGTRSDKLYLKPLKIDWTTQAVIKEGRLMGDGLLHFKNAQMGLENPSDELQTLLHRTLAGVENLDVTLALSGKPLSPRIELKTDLDNRLKARFKTELEGRKKAFEAQLKAEVAAALGDQLKQAGASAQEIAVLEKALAGKGNALKPFEDRLRNNLSEAGLKKRLEGQQKKKLEQEVKKLLPKL